MAVGTRCTYHTTPLHQKKLALASPTSFGHSVWIVRLQTKSHGVFCMPHYICQWIYDGVLGLIYTQGKKPHICWYVFLVWALMEKLYFCVHTFTVVHSLWNAWHYGKICVLNYIWKHKITKYIWKWKCFAQFKKREEFLSKMIHIPATYHVLTLRMQYFESITILIVTRTN
jgi:hypothetical protein